VIDRRRIEFKEAFPAPAHAAHDADMFKHAQILRKCFFAMARDITSCVVIAAALG
jgi:hypothetical protein